MRPEKFRSKVTDWGGLSPSNRKTTNPDPSVDLAVLRRRSSQNGKPQTDGPWTEWRRPVGPIALGPPPRPRRRRRGITSGRRLVDGLSSLGVSAHPQLVFFDPPAVACRAAMPTDSVLATWPGAAELVGVDLSLEERDRVSALPWRGQFSPGTVEHLLRALAPQGAVILDPFVGSGTTLVESARRGHPSVGLDINPAAIALASCAALASIGPKDREAMVAGALEGALDPSGGPLNGTAIETAHAIALLAHTERSTNAANRRLTALLKSLPSEPVATEALLRDARATGLADGYARVVVTSPPYINVFNYHQYGRPLTDSFGWPILKAARSEIGSNRQNRGNRFRTVIQYSIDMALALREMSRVLEVGGTAVLVLGRESRVRGVRFFNGEIVARLVAGLGMADHLARAERHFVSRFGQRIYEDVLVLKDVRPVAVDVEGTESVGRHVGVSALAAADATAEAASEIRGAIEDAPKIAASPIAAVGS